ncbi:MAG TPA: gephyrin-like molybdotransferase Glp [Terriglobia bacterium]|nr:gephyrin-like molybdotransferase Glp [Terriglobia bacterium]
MLSFEQALTIIQARVAGAHPVPPAETVRLRAARGRVLAEEIVADRDYPPFNRSTRDGFAVRSSEAAHPPVVLQRIAELRAGEHFQGRAVAGQCVQIMTGAPVPEDFDAVVMIEHVRAEASRVEINRALRPWENVVRRGSEAAAGSRILPPGRRLGPGEIGLLASVGKAQVSVFARPRVAVIPTGDEIVAVEQTPQWFQIRNSNAEMLAAQVESAGGVAAVQSIAADDEDALRRTILQGLEADLLILSGGVSMGKYDLVKQVLEELGAEIYFHGLAIRPGKPLLFGRARNKFFFGLPGNPVSSHVTFELFARPVVDALGGAGMEPPVFLRARLGKAMKHKNGLTTFLPARVEMTQGEAVASVVGWQGSGDLVGVAQANCFLVLHPEQQDLAAGEWVDILAKEK